MPITLDPVVVGFGSGSSDGPLPGSGVTDPGYGAVPTGIESKIVYNNLVLNDRKNYDTYFVTEIDGLHDADVRDSREVNPGFHGETSFGALYGGRTITIQGFIRAFSLEKMRDMQSALRQAFADVSNEKPLLFTNTSLTRNYYIDCRKVSPIQMREAQTNWNFSREFLITLRASNPRFKSYFQNAVTMPLTSGSGVNLRNRGNFQADPRITINGPFTNLTILNNANNQKLEIVGSLAAGKSIEVNIEQRTLTDSDGNSRFDMLSIDSDWLVLEPDIQWIYCSATGTTGASSVSFNWHDAWI